MRKPDWKIIGKKAFKLLRNQYILTLLIFVIWITIFDNNNLIERNKELKTRKKLRKEKEYHKQQIEDFNNQLDDLMSTDENLEKFAREQYLMKRENEDVYVFY